VTLSFPLPVTNSITVFSHFTDKHQFTIDLKRPKYIVKDAKEVEFEICATDRKQFPVKGSMNITIGYKPTQYEQRTPISVNFPNEQFNQAVSSILIANSLPRKCVRSFMTPSPSSDRRMRHDQSGQCQVALGKGVQTTDCDQCRDYRRRNSHQATFGARDSGYSEQIPVHFAVDSCRQTVLQAEHCFQELRKCFLLC
jgi:hypothetical protein